MCQSETHIPLPEAVPLVWLKKKVLLDKTAPVTWDAVYTFSVFKTCYLTPVAPQHITLNGLFLALQLLQEIRREIKVSSKDRSHTCSAAQATFLDKVSEEAALGGGDGDGRIEPPFVSLCPSLQVSPSDGEGSGKHLYLKSTLSTVPLSERSWGGDGRRRASGS